VRRLLATCFVVLALTGCTDEEPKAASEASESPSASASAAEASVQPAEVPEAPTEGSCYKLSLEEAARPTNEDEPIPCTSEHTARTVHVGEIDSVVEGHALGVDSDHVQDQLSGTCPKELATFLGGTEETRALSRFQAIWFSPTLEEYDAGADWFRCDVGAVGSPEKLLTLPSDQKLEGILDRPGALDTYGLCGTAQPGAEGFERVACALNHSWVAISTIPIAGGEKYPGVDAVREAGDEACSEEVRSRNDFVLEYTYGWEWPTLEQWAAGQRYGFCWAPNDLA
jgi:Septum formation